MNSIDYTKNINMFEDNMMNSDFNSSDEELELIDDYVPSYLLPVSREEIEDFWWIDWKARREIKPKVFFGHSYHDRKIAQEKLEKKTAYKALVEKFVVDDKMYIQKIKADKEKEIFERKKVLATRDVYTFDNVALNESFDKLKLASKVEDYERKNETFKINTVKLPPSQPQQRPQVRMLPQTRPQVRMLPQTKPQVSLAKAFESKCNISKIAPRMLPQTKVQQNSLAKSNQRMLPPTAPKVK